MNDTIRELVIKEFVVRAAVIVSTGSPQAYATDIGTNVLRARSKVAPADLPCCVIWPGSEEADAQYGQTRHVMSVRIDGLMMFGTDDQSVVSERILGDLISAFTSPLWDRRRPVSGSPVTYLPPYAESIVYQGGGTDDPSEDGATSAGASIRLVVTYRTAVGNPYSQ